MTDDKSSADAIITFINYLLKFSRFAYGYLVGNTSSIALAEASLEL